MLWVFQKLQLFGPSFSRCLARALPDTRVRHREDSFLIVDPKSRPSSTLASCSPHGAPGTRFRCCVLFLFSQDSRIFARSVRMAHGTDDGRLEGCGASAFALQRSSITNRRWHSLALLQADRFRFFSLPGPLLRCPLIAAGCIPVSCCRQHVVFVYFFVAFLPSAFAPTAVNTFLQGSSGWTT